MPAPPPPSPSISYSPNEFDHIYGRNADYAIARSTSAGALGGFTIGQNPVAMDYVVYRSYICFDTSIIPDNATIVKAYIEAKASRNDSINDDFDVELMKQNFTFPITTDREAKYDGALTASKDVTLFNSSIVLNPLTKYSFISPDIDPDWINKTGFTYYSMVSSRDISSITPTSAEYLFISEAVGDDIVMVVYYTLTSASVQSDIAVTTAETAQATDTKEPTSVSSSDVVTEENALSNDGTLSIMGQNAEITLSDYGISVPDGATITGIEIQPYTATDDGTADLSLYVSKDGTNFTKVESITSTGSTSAELQSVGGASDSLVLQWTPKELENFYSKVVNNSANEAYIGFVRVKVFYIFRQQKTPLFVTS